MGITLEQLTRTIAKVKEYADDKFSVVDPSENNAILNTENGIFVEDKQPQINELKESIVDIAKDIVNITEEITEEEMQAAVNEAVTEINNTVITSEE